MVPARLRRPADFSTSRRARRGEAGNPPPGKYRRRQEPEHQGSENGKRYQGVVPAEWSVTGHPGPKPEGTRCGQQKEVSSREDAESGKRLGDPEEERSRHQIEQGGEHEHDARCPDGVVVDGGTFLREFWKPDLGNAETHDREGRRERRHYRCQEESRPVVGTHAHPQHTIHLESLFLDRTLWCVGRRRSTSSGFNTHSNRGIDRFGVGDAGATLRSGGAPPRRRVLTEPASGRVPAARSPAPSHFVGSGDRVAGTKEDLEMEAAGREEPVRVYLSANCMESRDSGETECRAVGGRQGGRVDGADGLR